MTESDKCIKEAWDLIVNTRPDEILYTEEELRERLDFTTNFPFERIRTLQKKFIYIGSQALSKVLIYVIVLVLLATSVAAYAILKALQLDINEKNTDISVNTEQMAASRITERYYPQYIPENFHEASRNIFDTSITVQYTDGRYDIFYRQELLVSRGQIDNENTREESVNIAGTEGLFSEKHGEKTLIFSNSHYLFYIDSNADFISKDSLIQMAESLKKE